jgi:hypothetical protein
MASLSLENTSPHQPLLVYILGPLKHNYSSRPSTWLIERSLGTMPPTESGSISTIMMELACEKRKVAKAVAVGSVPQEMKKVWKQMEEQGIRTEVIDRSEMGGSEKDLPDLKLQREMLLDGMTNHKTPWTVVLLTGDGAGWAYGKWFLPTLKGMKEGGWNIELISWSQSCNRWLREWVIQNGHFTSLDDFYRSVTFLVPSENRAPLVTPATVAETGKPFCYMST